MAFDTYSDLQAEVADWLDRTDLTSQIKSFITLTEAKLNRRLRLREMETALSETIASGVITIPAGYIQMEYLYLDTSPSTPLIRSDLEYIYRNYPTRSSDARPAYYAREGSNIIFGPFPDSAYAVKGLYYKKLDVLSASNTSNAFLVEAPDALLYGALLHAEPFLKNDERIPLWKAAFDEALSMLQAEDDAEALSGSAIAVTTS